VRAVEADRPGQAGPASGGTRVADPSTTFDPLRYCIFTTIALLAWTLSPPIAVMLTSGLGLWAYARAWRAGLRRSRCFLGDVRVVLAFLGVAFLAGSAFAVMRLSDLVG
jgi:hypothetical protein